MTDSLRLYPPPDIAIVFIDACPARPTPPAAGALATAAVLLFYPNPASKRVQLELPGEGVKTFSYGEVPGKLVREIQHFRPGLYALPLQSVPVAPPTC